MLQIAVIARGQRRTVPSADEMLVIREEYNQLLRSTIALARLAKRIDHDGCIERAVVRLNAVLTDLDEYRARLL